MLIVLVTVPKGTFDTLTAITTRKKYNKVKDDKKMKQRRIIAMLLVLVFICLNLNLGIGVTRAAEVVTDGAIETEQETGESRQQIKKESVDTKEEALSTPEAATEEPRTVTSAGVKLRLMYTTDIHGQVTDYDYETNKTVNQGLSRVYTLMKEARKEVGDNYMTFDVGDSIMDYATDFIYGQDSTAKQPVYDAMTKIGYDAVTLGNHDFDYGYEYIVNQLETSGLMKKCILSNVTSAVNGKYVFGKENTIIEKKVTDEEGNVQTVKVGIFGLTPPSMSSRTESLKSTLTSEDMIVTAKREAALLKGKGADIIIALAHSGYGVEEPANRNANVVYALTKIPEIDVILAGHQHVYYPNSSRDAFYKFPGTDRETGLINGKRVIILKNSCAALGVVDLNLKVSSGGNVELESSDYEFRKVTSKVASDKEIAATMGTWDTKIKSYTSEKIGETADGERWTNYAALLEDTETIQVVHDAEMGYASRYIANNAPQYKDYPVISMAKYVKYGSQSAEDYVDISGDVTKGMLQYFANYHGYVYIYEITGKQLREYLEWGVSLYQTNYKSKEATWDDMVVSEYINNGVGESILQDAFLTNWSTFYVWNGIEYVVDNTVEPRYDSTGNQIADTNRIVSMTYNGNEITDDQRFVLCTEKISSAYNPVTADIQNQVIGKSHDITQNVIRDYLTDKALLGKISVQTDQNWTLRLPDNYQFIISSGANSESYFADSKWDTSVYSTLGEGRYYNFTYHKEKDEKDSRGPNVVLSANNIEETNGSVDISVLCNDKSGIGKKMYFQGKEDVNSKVWQDPDAEVLVVTGSSIGENGREVVTGSALEDYLAPKQIEGNTFTVTRSGVYSVYVEDGQGNATVEQIAITNIYPEILVVPTVNKVTNKVAKVTGTAEPNTTVHVVAGKTDYQGTVSADGSFTVTISPQKAGTVLSVYISDKKGRASKKTKVTVTRKGPNCPTISSAKNTGTTVKGSTNDSNVSIYAILNDTVYVSKSLGTGYYKSSKGYNGELPIKKTDITISSNGTYTITIPNQYYGEKIKVYAVDNLGRISYGRTVKISKAAPNRITMYASTDAEGYVFGYVPEDGVCTIAIRKNNGMIYYGKSDSDGFFAVKVGTIKNGDVFTGRAKIGSGSYSYPSTKTAISVNDVYTNKKDSDCLSLSMITDKDKEVNGKSDVRNGKVYIQVSGKVYAVKTDKNGKFTLKLSGYQKVDSILYVVSRNTTGSIRNIYRRKVVLGPPRTPKFVSGVKKNSQKVVAKVSEKCSVTLKIDKKKYTSASVKYSNSERAYLYTFKTQKIKEKQKVTLIAKNSGGSTKSATKTIPESKKKTTDKSTTTTKKK